jgi:serralysin
MQVGVTFNGTLENSGDRDWIRVSLTAGQAVQIDLGGRGDNAVYDTYLRLYNANGAGINEDDDSGYSLNSQLTFTPGTSGTYCIAAGSYADGYVAQIQQGFMS